MEETNTATAPAERSPGEWDEIRLTTVLIAGLSQADSLSWAGQPEQMVGATQTLLQIVSQAISRYEGQIVHFAGYSVQAISGLVQAYEDDPERAIHAALEIQALAHKERIEVTVGISTGHIYLGPVGPAVAHGPQSFGPVAIEVLNQGLRPFTAKWHPRLLAHEEKRPVEVSVLEHERAWEYFEEMRRELVDLQTQMRVYADILVVNVFFSLDLLCRNLNIDPMTSPSSWANTRLTFTLAE